MSSGQKAAYDDECDWEELKRTVKFKNPPQGWDVYLEASRLTKEGYIQHGMVGDQLQKWVTMRLELRNMELQTKKQNAEITAAITLLNRFGYTVTDNDI